MGKYIIVQHTSPKCWRVYIGDEDGNKFSTSLTDYYFDQDEARGRASYLYAYNDVDGILQLEEVK